MDNSKISTSKNDDYISDYLGDLLGGGISSELEENNRPDTSLSRSSELEPSEKTYVFAAPTVDRHHSLIPTLNLFAIANEKSIGSKQQSFLLLLISLYYLRRPLSDRVRTCFVKVSERMLDDFEAADWQSQINPTGVLSEARA